MKLDNTDKKLINLLQEDSKRTNKHLSLLLNLSVTAVFERIKKLERAEVITRYIAQVDPKKVDKSFIVFCQVKLIQHSREYLSVFESEILKLNEVSECFHISGDYDYVLKIYVKDMEEYREFMVNKLTTIKHIGSTQSSFMIGEVKNTAKISI
ncbi:AsnC family transcriptional regulator [Tenacibaculum sp. SZ-18]|uniref:Lrp/AsnC family transcriptional regulator n=1 Tax=Tenacibaculum sp. SZ-18 TaxID=754423 RepID=UPI000C2CEA26|nr:Lrp/AsnC family transcriptional regulator [Tenacibaculum sp. SZ-18]AUC13981.1 AsnC family transcriptional regulator [Tenacibaculum sp. SZ-18]